MNKYLFAFLIIFSTVSFADTLYITLEKDNALAVVNGETGQLLQTVPLGQRPRGVAFNNDKTQLYVAASDDDTIQVIDTASLKVVGELPSGDDPELFNLMAFGCTYLMKMTILSQ